MKVNYVRSEKALPLPNSKGKTKSRLHIFEYQGVKGQDPYAIAAKRLKSKKTTLSYFEKFFYVPYVNEEAGQKMLNSSIAPSNLLKLQNLVKNLKRL